MRRLFFDIEVSPNIGMFWQSGHEISCGYENIIKERAIICIAYKWSDSKKVYCLTWDKKQNDKKMLNNFLRVANQADELVGHNSDRFDIKWIRGRCFFHNIDMMPNFVSIDTLKEARKLFKLNSNRLDYISKFIGYEGKIKTEFNLWKEITINNCWKSLKKMVEYCKMDVIQLENTFNRMKKYIPPKSRTNKSAYASDCPECGSSDTVVNKHRMTAAGILRAQLQCVDCGKYHQINASKFEKAKRQQQADIKKSKK